MDCRWILVEFFNGVRPIASIFDHGSTPPFLLLFFFLFLFLSFFLLGVGQESQYPLVYMFLDSNALFVVCFLLHMI